MSEHEVRVRITPEYPGLVISDDGRIQGPSGQWLKPCPDSGGYMFITHCSGSRATQKRRRVHIIVCTVFHGHRPFLGAVAAHRDGDKSNNSAANLRWTTHAENNGPDKDLQGRTARGGRNASAKLTEDDVRELRRDWSEGVWATKKEAAAYFGVTDVLIGKVLRGEVWGWLK